jgi:cell shape-determining protein MreC
MWALIISLIALAIIAAVVLVLVFVVFAGDTGKAKDLMNKSDALMETVKTTGDKVGAAFNKLLTNLETSMTLTQYNEQVDAIKADTASAVKGLAEAKKGYQEILTLKGVDDYKRYANIVIKVINTDLEQIAAVKRFLDYSTGVLTDQATGKPLDTATFQATEEAAIARLNQLSNRAKTLKAEAVALKQQKDL